MTDEEIVQRFLASDAPWTINLLAEERGRSLDEDEVWEIIRQRLQILTDFKAKHKRLGRKPTGIPLRTRNAEAVRKYRQNKKKTTTT